MKITNSNCASNSVPPTQPPSTPAASGTDKTADTTSAASDGYTPSPEYQRLLDQVREHPHVRHHRVFEAAQKLANGDYSTPESVEKTADAILKAGDSL